MTSKMYKFKTCNNCCTLNWRGKKKQLESDLKPHSQVTKTDLLAIHLCLNWQIEFQVFYCYLRYDALETLYNLSVQSALKMGFEKQIKFLRSDFIG